MDFNITSNVVEDKVETQPKEAETGSSCSGDELPKQRSIINTPESRNGHSLRASCRISKQFEREGNLIGESEVECRVVDISVRELKDSFSGTASELESTQMRTKRRKCSPISVDSVLCNSKEAHVQNCSLLSQQNSKTFVQDCDNDFRNYTGVDIKIQRTPSLSLQIQSPPKTDTGPVLTFLDPRSEQFKSEANSVGEDEGECEMTDMPAREVRSSAPSNTCKQAFLKMGKKRRNNNPVLVHSVQDLRMQIGAPVSQSGVDIPIERSSTTSLLIQNSLEADAGPVLKFDSASKFKGNGNSVIGEEVECGVVETSIQDHRMRIDAPGNHCQSIVDIVSRSSSMSVAIQSPSKAGSGPVLTFPNAMSKQFEGEGNSVVESEVECEIVGASVGKLRGSFSFIDAKCDSGKIQPERRNKSSLSLSCDSNKASSHVPVCGQKSETSILDEKMKTHVLGIHTGVDIPVKGLSLISPLISGTCPLVTFPDLVVKECSTDCYCHVSKDGENSEITTWLEEQDKNFTASENTGVIPQKQNEFCHTDMRTNAENLKYQSVEALLKALDSDEDSNSFESDIENAEVGKMSAYNKYRPLTPGPTDGRKSSSIDCIIRDPMTAYVKVEKLTENKTGTMLKVHSKTKGSVVSPQTQKPERPHSQKQKVQSSQYR